MLLTLDQDQLVSRFIPAGRYRDRSSTCLETTSLAGTVMIFPGIVAKMRGSLTFLATIENDFEAMKTLAVISILALLTITGAIYTDHVFTSDQIAAQGTN
jgi:hypothetical protein